MVAKKADPLAPLSRYHIAFIPDRMTVKRHRNRDSVVRLQGLGSKRHYGYDRKDYDEVHLVHYAVTVPQGDSLDYEDVLSNEDAQWREVNPYKLELIHGTRMKTPASVDFETHIETYHIMRLFRSLIEEDLEDIGSIQFPPPLDGWYHVDVYKEEFRW